MMHHFKVALAKEFGIESAIMIDEFYFQISRNAANERNFHEGRYWTFNTLQAYTEIFPYFSIEQVRRIIGKLVSEGILTKGNFNDNPYNRTSWYAFTDKGETIVKKHYFHLSESPVPFCEINKCTFGEINKCKTSTITSTITSIYSTPSDEGSDSDSCSDAVASDMPMLTPQEENMGPRNKNVTSQQRGEWFEELWILYDRKGNKQIAKKEFCKLNPAEDDVEKMRMHIPAYVKAQPERKYRLDFERYIKRETFNTVVCDKENVILYDPEAKEHAEHEVKTEPAVKDGVLINGVKYR